MLEIKYRLLMQQLRRYFLAGLLIWLPIWVTLLVISFIISLFDSTVLLLPSEYRLKIPGLGIICSVLIVFVTGMLVTNFLGRRLIVFGEAIVARIPIVRSIYSAVKQVIETLFSTSGQSFRKVYLIEYPRQGVWSVAFQTGFSTDEITAKAGETLLTLFIPTTPNPTSGFMMMVAAKDAIELQMTVEQALKFIISLGVVQPGMIDTTPPVTNITT